MINLEKFSELIELDQRAKHIRRKIREIDLMINCRYGTESKTLHWDGVANESEHTYISIDKHDLALIKERCQDMLDELEREFQSYEIRKLR